MNANALWRRSAIVLSLAGLAASSFAQTAAETVQRDANQQQRIEQGLRSGSLTTHEAGQLERAESRVDRDQAQALQDGKLSPQERRRLAAEQNRVSREIHADKTNARTGNPDSASSRRLQADVQRNDNQQQRIANGLRDGSLTKGEAAGLERGQAKVDRREANAAADGHVGAREQARIQRTETRQSHRIHRERHDAAHRHEG